MGFPRQESWSGQSFPSPGNLPQPGIEPGSPTLQEDFFFFNTEPQYGICVKLSLQIPPTQRTNVWIPRGKLGRWEESELVLM